MKIRHMKDKIILLGCGGHAKSVIDAIEAAGKYQIAGMIDSIYPNDFEYRGYKVIGCDEQLQKYMIQEFVTLLFALDF